MRVTWQGLFLHDGLILEGEEQAVERGGEDGGEQWGEYGGGDEPDDEGVPLPSPEEAGGVPRVIAYACKECGPVEGEASGVEDGVASADEDEKED